MAILGYARVSHIDMNIETQLEALTHCDKIFQEKESGAKDNRPQLKNLLDYMREGDVVEVTRLDRLGRSTSHLLKLVELFEEKKVSLRIQNINLDTGTATGKLMLTMLAAISEFERSLLKEKQLAGIERAKKAGVYKGRRATAMEKKEQVVKMVEQGMKKTHIAKELGMSLASVYNVLKTA
jgi:DNA invertase Pin-like site-specific DNA recombinase